MAASQPEYFKCCRLLKNDSNSIQLVMDNWPTYMMVHGCSSNLSVNDKLTTLLGL